MAYRKGIDKECLLRWPLREGGPVNHERSRLQGFERYCVALVAAGLLVAGCGTRLDDAEIRAGVFEGEQASATSATVDGMPSPETVGPDAAGLPAPEPSGPTSEAGIGTKTVVAGASGASNVAGQVQRNSGGSGGSRTSPASGPAAKPGGAAPAASAAAASRIAIGHIGDYSGVVGAVLGPGALGMQVAVRHINDHGGLAGHPVQLIVGDAAGDPARALSLARDMVENKGVIAFSGNIWPLSSSGPKSYLEEKRIPVLGGDVATTVWISSPMYFPNGAAFPVTALAAAKTSVDAGRRKVALVHCVEAEPCAIWDKTLSAEAGRVGAQLVYKAQVSLAQPDYTAECLQAQRNGAEGILAALDGGSLTRLARSCTQQGYRPQYVTMNLATTPAMTKDPNLEGLLTPTSHFPYVADDTPATREYHAAIDRYAPGQAGPATATTWAAAALLREAGKALPANPTPADFLEGAWRIKDNNLGGLTIRLTFVRDRSTTSPPECYFVLGVKGRRYVAPQGSKPNCL